jgi:hypothetical protein
MKATTMTVRVMAHFRLAEIGGGSGAGAVMRTLQADWRGLEAPRPTAPWRAAAA